MDKLLNTCTLWSLNQEEVETLNRPITGAKVKAGLIAYQTKKAQVQMGSQKNSTRLTKRRRHHSWNHSKQHKKRESFPNHFMRPTLSWYQNLAETQQIKKTSGEYPWWTQMQKSSIKYWHTNCNSISKRLFITIKYASSCGCKAGSTYVKLYMSSSHIQN